MAVNHVSLDASTLTAGAHAAEFQAAIDAVPWSSNDPLVLTLEGDFWFEQPVRFASPTKPNGKFILRGQGSTVWWQGTAGDGAFIIGDDSAGKKAWWSLVEDLIFKRYPLMPDGITPTSETAAIFVEDADSLALKRISGTAGAYGLNTGPLVKYLNLEDCFFSGSSVACQISGNGISIHNCKFQQSPIGLYYTGATLYASNLDCSFCTEDAIQLVDAGNIHIHGYCEKIGPKETGNTSACVRMQGVRGAYLQMMLNCVWGAGSEDTHCAYGVHASESSGVELWGGYIQNSQIAGVFLAPGCKDITVRRSCYWIPDRTPGVLLRGDYKAVFLEPGHQLNELQYPWGGF